MKTEKSCTDNLPEAHNEPRKITHEFRFSNPDQATPGGVSFLDRIRKTIRVPKAVINDHSLMFLYFVRSKFTHPVITNYTPKKLGELTNRSENTIRRYVSIWIRNGYAEIRGKHLHLKKYKRKNTKEKLNVVKISILPWTDLQTFKLRVQTAQISRHLAQQRWAAKCKENYAQKNLIDKHVDMRLLKQHQKRYGLVGDQFTYKREPFVSSRSIANDLGVSQTKANNILREAEKSGYFDRKMIIEEFHDPKAMHYIGGHIYSVPVKRSRSTVSEEKRFFSHHGVKLFFIGPFLFNSPFKDRIKEKRNSFRGAGANRNY